jgi:hypothetical protein
MGVSMPAKPPKCKLCGSEHWNSEPHVLPKGEQVTVTKAPAVTKAPVPIVTKPIPVTKASEGRVGTTGRPRLYATNADRQRAYRARRTTQ